jgi:hypothetical protein
MRNTAPFPATQRGDHLRTATPEATFQTISNAFAGQQVDPADLDVVTLAKVAILAIAMVDPKRPAAVLDIVHDRLQAAEDVAAVRHLFDESGQPL